MRTAAICPTCATYENALCVLYNGPYLSVLNINPLDSMQTVVQKINTFVSTLQPALGFTPENVANKVLSKADLISSSTSIIKYPSVKAVYDWVSTTYEPLLGFVPENVANKSTDNTLGGLTPSNTLYPSQKAVKEYVDNNIPTTLYKVYTGLLSFDGLNITEIVLENTLGITINWTNPSNGIIKGTASSGTPFTNNKTWIIVGSYDNSGTRYFVTGAQSTFFPTTQVDFNFAQFDNSQTSTPAFTNVSVEIRVYN